MITWKKMTVGVDAVDGHYLGPVEGDAEQAIGAEPAQHRDGGLGYDDEQISRLLQRRIGVRGLLR